MKTITLNILSEQSNHAVVQLPQRRFPGSVVQGDSLAILCSEAKEISQRLMQTGCTDEDLLYLAQEHQEKLLARLLQYQEVLAAHGIPLPYSLAAKPLDFVALIAGNDGDAL